MFSYYTCGLGIASALPLPELIESQAKADVTIKLGKIDPLPCDSNKSHNGLFATGDEVYFYWKDVGTFLIRGGREIVIDPAPGVEERVLRLFLLGRVLGTLLHMRGLLVLHASAVAVRDGAIAFIGAKSTGKSTTAAAMYSLGHSMVSDDVVALEVDGVEVPKVFPGYPHLKLWPDAAASLGDVAEALPRLHPGFEKRARRASRGFSPEPLPLRCIYVLDEGDTHQIEPIPLQDAFIELVRHTYAVQLLGATGTFARHFRQCKALVEAVSLRRLRRLPSLTLLTEIAGLVEEDTLSLVNQKARSA